MHDEVDMDPDSWYILIATSSKQPIECFDCSDGGKHHTNNEHTEKWLGWLKIVKLEFYWHEYKSIKFALAYEIHIILSFTHIIFYLHCWFILLQDTYTVNFSLLGIEVYDQILKRPLHLFLINSSLIGSKPTCSWQTNLNHKGQWAPPALTWSHHSIHAQNEH